MSKITILLIGILIGFLAEYQVYRADERNTYIIGCSDAIIESYKAISTNTLPKFCNELVDETNWRSK